MPIQKLISRLAFVAVLALPSIAPAQQVAPEVAEMRRRVAAIRQNMAAYTEAAEYVADVMTRDSSLRFLTPWGFDPGLGIEFNVHAGGPPDTHNADDYKGSGVVLFPVRSWAGGAFAVAGQFEHWQSMGRVVITFGSVSGKPRLPIGNRLLDNGAPDASDSMAALNAIANMMGTWVFYTEFVAAATRRGWQPGIYLSILMPFSERNNSEIKFRMPSTGDKIAPIAAGTLGKIYLDSVDATLIAASTPEHQVVVQHLVDSLKARRTAGARLFVASCGHYLMGQLPTDTINSPFRPVEWRWDVEGRFKARGAKSGDAVLWLGYGGYDCPNIEVARPFANMGLSVAIVSNKTPPANAPGTILGYVPLAWALPDAAVSIPFPPGSVGPISSIDMAVHYEWIRRLVGK